MGLVILKVIQGLRLVPMWEPVIGGTGNCAVIGADIILNLHTIWLIFQVNWETPSIATLGTINGLSW
jgi:hypothetical protein